MKLSWASTYAEARAGTLDDTIFKTQRAGKYRYPKNYFAVTLAITQRQATSQENRTFQNTWQTCQSDQYKFNKHIHCPDMEPSYSQARHQQA